MNHSSIPKKYSIFIQIKQKYSASAVFFFFPKYQNKDEFAMTLELKLFCSFYHQ